MTKAKPIILSLIAVMVMLVPLVYWGITGSPTIDKRPSRAEMEAACEILLQNAKMKADQAVTKRAAEFTEFINSRKLGAGAFAQDVVSLKGKWVAAKSMVPGTDKVGHEKYVIAKFNEHIFKPEDLERATNRAINGGIYDVDGIENELAIALRQEISGQSLSPSDLPTVAAEFKNAINLALRDSKKDVIMATGGLVATEVSSQIGAQVLVRLGVSAGILATAATNSWWTLGGALVIGVAVDALWSYVTHPAATIENQMVLELNKMALNGSSLIQEELKKIVSTRSLLWQKTLKDFLQ